MNNAIALIGLGILIAVCGGVIVIATTDKWGQGNNFILSIVGLIIFVIGFWPLSVGFTGYEHQNSYKSAVTAYKVDQHDGLRNSRKYHIYHHQYVADKKQLAQMSATDYRNPKLANLRASQAQDYFNRRNHLKRQVRKFKNNSQYKHTAISLLNSEREHKELHRIHHDSRLSFVKPKPVPKPARLHY